MKNIRAAILARHQRQVRMEGGAHYALRCLPFRHDIALAPMRQSSVSVRFARYFQFSPFSQRYVHTGCGFRHSRRERLHASAAADSYAHVLRQRRPAPDSWSRRRFQRGLSYRFAVFLYGVADGRPQNASVTPQWRHGARHSAYYAVRERQQQRIADTAARRICHTAPPG